MGDRLNDHINMLSAQRGIKKAVPCWQIEEWIKRGYFSLSIAKGNRVGWDFFDHAAGLKDYSAWITDQEAKREEARRRRSRTDVAPPPAYTGIAGAMFERRETEWTPPPEPAVEGVEDVADIRPAFRPRDTAPPEPPPKTERPKPKDMLDTL
jgi:hypothetical protein